MLLLQPDQKCSRFHQTISALLSIGLKLQSLQLHQKVPPRPFKPKTTIKRNYHTINKPVETARFLPSLPPNWQHPTFRTRSITTHKTTRRKIYARGGIGQPHDCVWVTSQGRPRPLDVKRRDRFQSLVLRLYLSTLSIARGYARVSEPRSWLNTHDCPHCMTRAFRNNINFIAIQRHWDRLHKRIKLVMLCFIESLTISKCISDGQMSYLKRQCCCHQPFGEEVLDILKALKFFLTGRLTFEKLEFSSHFTSLKVWINSTNNVQNRLCLDIGGTSIRSILREHLDSKKNWISHHPKTGSSRLVE